MKIFARFSDFIYTNLESYLFKVIKKTKKQLGYFMPISELILNFLSDVK